MKTIKKLKKTKMLNKKEQQQIKGGKGTICIADCAAWETCYYDICV